MRIVFAGTPGFAAVALAAILDAGHEVPLVLTQPDRPAGRGLKPRAGAVAALAAARGLALAAPQSLRPDAGAADAREALQRLRAVAPDLIVVAAYGLILPQAVLDLPRGVAGRSGVARAVNIHASLLPRWRGAAPIARAIEAGDQVSGITLMQMEAGLDSGPVLLSEAVPIGPAETAATLTTRLAEAGARLIVSWLAQAPQGRWTAAAQPAAGVSYARKISKQEAWLDWRQPAAVLAHRVRAFDPEPGARSRLRDRIVKIWSAEAESQPAGAEPGTAVSAQADTQPAEAGARSPEPGTVLAAQADGIRVACGDGVLVIRELQRAGGRRLRAREFLAGTALAAGARWQPPPAPDEAG